jgi:DNA-binding CsgD family transcriptional regulator
MQYTPTDMAAIFSRGQHKSPDLSLFKPTPRFEEIMNQSCAFYSSIDFAGMEYIYLSCGVQKVLGYEQKDWIEQGLSFFFKILYPEDREALRSVHLDIMQACLACPGQDLKDLSFDFDFRVIAADRQLVRLNQQMVIVATDPIGLPLVDFSVCTDISSYKSDGPVSLHIKKSRKQQERPFVKHLVYDEAQCPLDLSCRELEVIELLSEGLTSRQVSQQLNISQHTVRTHRKNILKKTRCNSTVELVNLAKNRGMLRPPADASAKKKAVEPRRLVESLFTN